MPTSVARRSTREASGAGKDKWMKKNRMVEIGRKKPERVPGVEGLGSV